MILKYLRSLSNFLGIYEVSICAFLGIWRSRAASTISKHKKSLHFLRHQIFEKVIASQGILRVFEFPIVELKMCTKMYEETI